MDVKSLLPSSDEQSSQLQQACTKLHEERNLDTSSIGAHLREFQQTNRHQNADAVSCPPSSKDPIFDDLSQQIKSTDSSLVKKEISKAPVLAKVMRFRREG